ncbi:MAG: cytochrome c biogenesis protein ResB [Candidatus Nanopelagicales bacterium]
MSSGPALDVRPPAAQPPPMDAGGWARWLWRQLTSMRTALVLLFLLAVAAIPGSVFPQRGTDPLAVNAWIERNPGWGPVLDRLGMFDVYASPWFAATYLLLFVSLVGCVLPRARQHWRAVRARPPAAPRRLSRLPVYRTEVLDLPPGPGAPAVLSAARVRLRSQRWRLAESPYDATVGSGWVAAEKGYARETGNLLFHVALVALLAAVAYGGLFGWKGNVIVKEGAGFSNTLTQYDAWGGGRFVDPQALAPFSFTLTDFAVDFERGEAQRGAPRMFEATLAVRDEPTDQPRTEVVEVNEPLVVDGAKVFLVGHGYAPTFVVRDADGRVVFDDAVVFLPQDGNFTSTGVVKVPDAAPALGLQGIFLPTAAVDDVRGPHSTFPAPDDPAVFLSAWVGDLGLDSGVPQSIFRLDTTAMEQLGLRALRPGESWELPDGAGSVQFTGYGRWASFQIAHDPGKEAALAAAALALVGLLLSLFVRRRRVWVRARDDGMGRTLIEVAGLSRTEAGGLDEEIDELAGALAAVDGD